MIPLEKVKDAFSIMEFKELSQYSLQGRNVLMAIGARHLCEAVSSAQKAGANVFARVLPTPESLRQALMCSLSESDLAVIRPLQGTCKGDYERALCKRWSISDVVCRQSGGLTQQLWQNLCQDMKISLWLIARPSLDSGVAVSYSLNSLLERITII